MDLVKTSVESYTAHKMGIRQLVEVVRRFLIERSKNPKNGLEDGILETPMYLSIYSNDGLNLIPPLFLPSKSNASEAINEFNMEP